MKKFLEKRRQKKQEKKERDEEIVRDFLFILAHAIKMKHDENIVQYPPAQPAVELDEVPVTGTVHRRPVRRWVACIAACFLCFMVAIPFFTGGLGVFGRSGGGYTGGGSGGSGERVYYDHNVRVLGPEEGVFFEDLYARILASENLLIFNNIMSGFEAWKEVYDDGTDSEYELLSYVLRGFIADASDASNMVAFVVDFRIRFAPQYLFQEYASEYKFFEESFSVGSINIQWELRDAVTRGAEASSCGSLVDGKWVNLRFNYRDNDYFLRIRAFEVPGLGVVTELTEANIILLMQNLLVG